MKVRLEIPIPRGCWNHIQKRIKQGKISVIEQKALFNWLSKRPIVIDSDWYKQFNNFYVVGTGPYATSILDKPKVPWGTEII